MLEARALGGFGAPLYLDCLLFNFLTINVKKLRFALLQTRDLQIPDIIHFFRML